MNKLSERLALYTWSLDTTPLAEALKAARDGGWNAVELRRVDFVPAEVAREAAAAIRRLLAQVE